eukprot:3932492-Rhodomonas_salina.2
MSADLARLRDLGPQRVLDAEGAKRCKFVARSVDSVPGTGGGTFSSRHARIRGGTRVPFSILQFRDFTIRDDRRSVPGYWVLGCRPEFSRTQCAKRRFQSTSINTQTQPPRPPGHLAPKLELELRSASGPLPPTARSPSRSHVSQRSIKLNGHSEPEALSQAPSVHWHWLRLPGPLPLPAHAPSRRLLHPEIQYKKPLSVQFAPGMRREVRDSSCLGGRGRRGGASRRGGSGVHGQPEDAGGAGGLTVGEDEGEDKVGRSR